MTVCCAGWTVYIRLYRLMMGLDTPETCRGLRNILRMFVHQIGFPLHDYIDMHGQQNKK